MGVISILVHQFKQFGIQDLHKEKVVKGGPLTRRMWVGEQIYSYLTAADFQHHLDQRAHVGKMSVHGSSVWKVLIHSLHELGETAEGDGL